MVAWNIYILIFVAFLWQALYSKNDNVLKLENEKQIKNALKPLKSVCIDNVLAQQWWAYSICFENNIKQIHYDFSTNELKQSYTLGDFIPEKSTPNHQVFHENTTTCLVKDTNELRSRHAEVSIECCGGDMGLMKTTRQSLQASEGVDSSSVERIKNHQPLPNLYISSVVEPVPCSYFFTVCSELMCTHTAQTTADTAKKPKKQSSKTSKKQSKSTPTAAASKGCSTYA